MTTHRTCKRKALRSDLPACLVRNAQATRLDLAWRTPIQRRAASPRMSTSREDRVEQGSFSPPLQKRRLQLLHNIRYLHEELLRPISCYRMPCSQLPDLLPDPKEDEGVFSAVSSIKTS
jgi:hypothetical protein